MEVEVADALEAGAGEFGLAAAPMQLVQTIDACRAAASALAAAPRPPAADGGLRRDRDRRRGWLGAPGRRRGGAALCPTSARSTAGSTRAGRCGSSVDGGGDRGHQRLREAVSPGGELHRSAHATASRCLTPYQLEREAARRDLRSLRADRAARRRRGRTRPSSCWRAAMSELRLLALYPEQMNIYADRGNIIFLRRRCEWRGIGFDAGLRGTRRGLRPRSPRPDLHRRRPGPRPGARRRGHASRRSAAPCPRRSTTAPPCSPSAAATSCSGTPTSSVRSGSRASAWPTWRRCASPARA